MHFALLGRLPGRGPGGCQVAQVGGCSHAQTLYSVSRGEDCLYSCSELSPGLRVLPSWARTCPERSVFSLKHVGWAVLWDVSCAVRGERPPAFSQALILVCTEEFWHQLRPRTPVSDLTGPDLPAPRAVSH